MTRCLRSCSRWRSLASPPTASISSSCNGRWMAELDQTAPEKSAAVRVLRTVAWGFARVFSIVALAVAWEWFARSGAVTPFMLPRLSLVLERIWSDLITGDLLMNTGVTVYRAMAGFAIAAVAGIVLGMAISRGKLAHWFFDP